LVTIETNAGAQTKLSSLIKAVTRVHQRQCGNATPTLRALIARKSELNDVELVQALPLMGNEFSSPGLEGHFVITPFRRPGRSSSGEYGRRRHTPIFSQKFQPSFFRSTAAQRRLLQVHRRTSTAYEVSALEVLASKAAAETARTLIVQVNEHMPRVLETLSCTSRVHAIVESNEPLPELENSGSGDVERQIGQHIATMIPDGATLQMGIGTIPDAVLASLSDKRDLGCTRR
jgi:hypothetical protein